MGMIGRSISHYRVVEKIGGGGMGVVYRAEDTHLGRQVALKFLPPFLSDDTARERFFREARAASALDHTNICTIYEIDQLEDGQVFIAMACYGGESLRQRIARGPLPLYEALEIATQMARGLEHAHGAGILHRDVKPANVLITERGEVKIVDFGVAKIATETGTTGTGSLGTPAYMAPEQLSGGTVDHRADVWSLGVVLYEMLAGRRPFPGNNAWEPLTLEPDDLGELRPDLSPLVVEIVGRLLARDPGQRYQSCRELLNDLERISRPTASTFLRLPPPPVRRRRTLLALAGAVGLVALLVVAYLAGRSTPRVATAGPTAVAVLPFSVQGEGGLDYLGEGMVDLLSAKLDGAGGLRAVDPNAVVGYVSRRDRNGGGIRDPRRAAEIAEHFGAKSYVVGSVLALSESLELQATLYADGGDPVRATARAQGEDGLFGAIDQLAQQLIGGRFAGPEARLKRLATLTTDSLPALKAYLAGEQAFRTARFDAAAEAFERAVSEDPDFVLAWYRLTTAAGWVERPDLEVKARARTLELADRLGERERLLLEASVAGTSGDAPRAEGLYRSILARYPDDVEALRGLGDLLFHFNPLYGRPRDESLEYFERALNYDPENREMLFHLISIALVDGRNGDAIEVIDRFLGQGEEPSYSALLRALRAFAGNDPAAREESILELRDADPSLLTVALNRLTLELGDFPLAWRLTEELAGRAHQPSSAAMGRLYQSFMHMAEGRLGAAHEAALEARDAFPAAAVMALAEHVTVPFRTPSAELLDEVRSELEGWDPTTDWLSRWGVEWSAAEVAAMKTYFLALVDFKRGDRAAFAASLEGLRRAEGSAMIAALAHTLEAVEAWNDGDAPRTLSLLDEAHLQGPSFMASHLGLYVQPLNRYLRAEALRSEGRSEEALAFYRSLSDGLFAAHLPYLAPSYARRAEIHAERGEDAEAAVLYERFLELWQDCDPELAPWVEEARRRRSPDMNVQATF